MKQVQITNLFKSLVCAIKSLGTPTDPIYVYGVTGTVETPLTIEDTDTGVTNTTPVGVKSFSILFEGSGGEINGVADIVSGYTDQNSATLGNTLAAKSYKVPTVADPNFPASPRVVISYII